MATKSFGMGKTPKKPAPTVPSSGAGMKSKPAKLGRDYTVRKSPAKTLKTPK